LGMYIQTKIDATNLAPAPKQRSKQQMIPVPKYTPEQINSFLTAPLDAAHLPDPSTDIDFNDPFSIDAHDDGYKPRKEYRMMVPTE